MQFRPLHKLSLLAASVLLVSCYSRGGIIHWVEPGESLIQIAHVYDSEIQEILNANRIENPNFLKSGQKLLIPGAKERKRVPKYVWKNTGFEPAEDDSGASADGKAAKAKTEPEEIKPTKTLTRSPEYREKKVVARSGIRFSWPAKGKILSPYGMRNKKMHNGIDIAVDPGSSIFAVADGKVVYRGSDIEGYGNIVIVKHSADLFSVYAYLGSILVDRGTIVQRGVALAKASERISNAFFHFEIRNGKKALDPVKILP